MHDSFYAGAGKVLIHNNHLLIEWDIESFRKIQLLAEG
jgi:hypothetical protein